jgi:hypothetical protein
MKKPSILKVRKILYVINTFRDDGHFSGVQRIECADERQAVKQARRLVDLQNGEVWERDRLIARFPERQKTTE